MCVPVSSSIWVNGLQDVGAPVTAGVGDAQTADRSNDDVTASVSETAEGLRDKSPLFLFPVRPTTRMSVDVLLVGRLVSATEVTLELKRAHKHTE